MLLPFSLDVSNVDDGLDHPPQDYDGQTHETARRSGNEGV
jgi:hypothetical protein